MTILLIMALLKLISGRGRIAENEQEDTVAEHSEKKQPMTRPIGTQNIRENDSFERCLVELRRRFEGRGIVQNVRRDAKKQTLAAMSARAMAPSAYADYGTRTSVSERFRTGTLNGERYMTVQDFARYYAEHRRRTKPDADYPSMAVVHGSSGNAPMPRKVQKSSILPVADASDREFVGRVVSKLPVSVKGKHPVLEEGGARVHKWLTQQTYEKAPASEKRKFPVSVASAILVMVVSLSLMVGGSAMYSEAYSEYSAASENLEAILDEEANLEKELSVKLDLTGIEDYAKNTLGMVDKSYIGGEYVSTLKEESVEVYGDEKTSFGLSTLLSVFGFGE